MKVSLPPPLPPIIETLEPSEKPMPSQPSVAPVTCTECVNFKIFEDSTQPTHQLTIPLWAPECPRYHHWPLHTCAHWFQWLLLAEMETKKAQRTIHLTIVPWEPNGNSLDATDVVVLPLVVVVVVKGPAPMLALLSFQSSNKRRLKIQSEAPIWNLPLQPPSNISNHNHKKTTRCFSWLLHRHTSAAYHISCESPHKAPQQGLQHNRTTMDPWGTKKELWVARNETLPERSEGDVHTWPELLAIRCC